MYICIMYDIYIYVYIYNIYICIYALWHMSCHKAIVVITRRTHCSDDKIYIILILLL